MTEVRVKKLEWYNDRIIGKAASAAGLGVYRIHNTGKFWYLNQDYMGEGGEIEAQADFERRVLSCLEMPNE